jgi:large repetitive protein
VAKPDSGATPANSPLTGPSLLTNDIGTGLAITSNTHPGHGTVVINADGTYVYTPSPNYSGPDVFTYTVTDANGKTSTTTVTLTVTPKAPDDSGTTPANTAFTGPSVLTNDTGTNLTVTANTQPSHGTVAMNPNGTYVYTPAPGFSGVDSFTYTTTDASGNTKTATVFMTVTPTALPDTSTTPANTPITGPSVLGNDVGTTLEIKSHSQPANGTVTMGPDGTYVYTPNPGFSGVDTFTYTAVDPTGQLVTSTVTIVVTPTAANDAGVTPVDTAVNGSVLGNDIGTGLTVTSNTQPSNGTVTVHPNGTYTYVPNPGYTGPDSFTYTITDANGKTASATVNLMVRPLAVPDTNTGPMDTPLKGSVLGNDKGTGLTVTGNSKPSHGTVTMNADGTYEYIPASGFHGVDSFTYTITDAAGQSVTTTVTITIPFPVVVPAEKPAPAPATTEPPAPTASSDQAAPAGTTPATTPATTPDVAAAPLAPSTPIAAAEAAAKATGVVQGTLWIDRNNDGQQASSELLIGARVTLVCNGLLVGTTTATPKYKFTQVPEGECKVTIDPTSVPAEISDLVDPSGRSVFVKGEQVINLDDPFAVPANLAFTGSDARLFASLGAALLGLGLLIRGRRHRGA